MSLTLQDGIRMLQEDHQNGARILATNALTILRDLAAEEGHNVSTAPEFWDALCLAGWKLKMARPSMDAAIGSAIIQALQAVKKRWVEECGIDVAFEMNLRVDGGKEIWQLMEVAVKAIDSVIETRALNAQTLASHFQDWLVKKIESLGRQTVRILTLSYSSSMKICLEHVIQELPQLKTELKILESRPGCEGASLAKSLVDRFASSTDGIWNRLSIQVEPDSSVALLAKNIDILLLGADRISSNGDVSNKMGSLTAAICAKTLSPSVEVVVLSESDKIVGIGDIGENNEEENDKGEVTAIWNINLELVDKIEVRNVYFEWVPARWIDRYICENGILRKGEVCHTSIEIKRREEGVFGKFNT